MTNNLKIKCFLLRYKEYIKIFKTPQKISSRTKFIKPYKKFLKNLYLNKNLQETIYILVNNLSRKDILCPVCKSRDKKFYTITKGYNLTCSQSCSTSITNLKRDKETHKKQGLSLKKTYKERGQEITNKTRLTKKKNKTNTSAIAKEAYKKLPPEKKNNMKSFLKIQKENPSKWKEIHLRAAKTLKNKIDKNGNNHYNRIHLKKLNDIDEYGNNWYKRRNIRNYKNGIWTNPKDMKDFQFYSYLCRKATEKQPLYILENIEKRGPANKGKYHLDHKYSIFQGFKERILPFIIGDICNLEMIKGINNLVKSRGCSISKEELINKFYKDKNETQHI